MTAHTHCALQRKLPLPQCALAALLLAPWQLSHAGHALVPLGFGPESNAMAGTDMAFSSSPSGINNNPAGIARAVAPKAEMAFEPHIVTAVRHKDSLGNDSRSDHGRSYLFSGGWLSPLPDVPDLILGLGGFAQGGVGFRYNDLLTDFGNRDRVAAILGVLRIAPALAYRPSDKLRLGISASVNYAEAEQDVLPASSNAESVFFGTRLSDLSGVSYSWKAGLQYDISESMTLGLAYSAPTKLNLRSGHATVNFDSIGLGRVRYGNAEVDGMALPEEIGIGLAWQLSPQLTVGADFNWYSWSDGIGSVTTRLSRPKAAAPSDKVVNRADFAGKDNGSQSIAVQYAIDDARTLYGGISHTENVLEARGLSPLNNYVARWHISAGYRHQFSDALAGMLSYTYLPWNTRSYNNRQLPLGERGTEQFEYYSVVFAMQYDW